MANTTGWIAGRGQGLTWGSAGFTAANFNSLANGAGVVAATAIVNGTNLDLYADVSFSLVVGGTTAATSFMALYLLPLNQDGTTYGDNTTGSTLPAGAYLMSSAGVLVGVASGSAVYGTFRGVILPPGSFKFTISNNLGVALNAAAAAVVSYRTYNENLNA
jgi:hypothetical protein